MERSVWRCQGVWMMWLGSYNAAGCTSTLSEDVGVSELAIQPALFVSVMGSNSVGMWRCGRDASGVV